MAPLVNSMCIHKPININYGTVMKNAEMLKFVSDDLTTKHMCSYAVKKLLFVIR